MTRRRGGAADHGLVPLRSRRPTGDHGNALVEFTYLSVLLMVPLVYVLLTVFQVQRAAFAVTEAARQAGRAYATADTAAAGTARAEAAASLALQDQGLELAAPPEIIATAGVAPDSQVTTTVLHRVTLPLFGGLFAGAVPPNIPVRATHVEHVDRYQSEGPA